MQEFIVYLVKVTVCSGILFLYYRAALYNKNFNQWNRLYLLSAVLLSLVVPLLQLPVLDSHSVSDYAQIKSAGTIFTDTGFNEKEREVALHYNYLPAALLVVYLSGCVLILAGFVKAIVKLGMMIRWSPSIKEKEYTIVFTSGTNGPFSFFHYIFWNSYEQYCSDNGKYILAHEKIHVRQWHSLDKILMNIIMIIYWCNPFFWLIRRELNMVHEFIADKRMIPDGNEALFSEIILSASYPANQLNITSHFFSSSIKRRLIMITTSKTKNSFYLKILALPVVFGLLMVFSFTEKNEPLNASSPSKITTIVIDAGHGGEDNGAVSANGTNEKNIVLAIAKKVQELNKDNSVHIVLTRSTDVLQPLKEKVAETVRQKADAFISLHVNADDKGPGGFDLYISNRMMKFEKQSQALGTALTHEIKKIYAVKPVLQKRKETGIWVLDASEITYPAVILECGNLLNPKDLSYITDPVHQTEIAGQILKGIADYINQSATAEK